MVNENYFRFDRKAFFNFWKKIYGFKNRKSFSEIKLFILARTFDIRLPESGNGWSSESRCTGIRPLKYCQRQNPATSGHRHRMLADQISAEIGRNLATVRSGPNLAKMARIRLDLTRSGGVRPEFGYFSRNPAKHARRNPATVTGRCRIPTTVAFSPFVIFSCKPNAENIFKKIIFLKIISSKIFYNKNYFTTKQTEH
jgi:hypothetical protein